MPKLNNTDAGRAARNRESFDGGTLFGRKYLNDLYVVYSYGYHFPMYVYDYKAGKWVGNSDKYSRTTTRHQLLCRPSNVDVWVDTRDIQTVAARGIAGLIARRMLSHGSKRLTAHSPSP